MVASKSAGAKTPTPTLSSPLPSITDHFRPPVQQPLSASQGQSDARTPPPIDDEDSYPPLRSTPQGSPATPSTALPPKEGPAGAKEPSTPTATTVTPSGTSAPAVTRPSPNRPRVLLTPSTPKPATAALPPKASSATTRDPPPPSSPPSRSSSPTTGTYTPPSSPSTADLPRPYVPVPSIFPSCPTPPSSPDEYMTPDSPTPLPFVPLPPSSSPSPAPHATAQVEESAAEPDSPPNEVMDLISEDEDYLDDDDHDEEMKQPTSSSPHVPSSISITNAYSTLGRFPKTPPVILSTSTKRPRSPPSTAPPPTSSKKSKEGKKLPTGGLRSAFEKTPKPTPTPPSTTPSSSPQPLPAATPPTHPSGPSGTTEEVKDDGFEAVKGKKKKAGRPVGSGGPTKQAIADTNAALQAEVTLLKQTIARLSQSSPQAPAVPSPPPAIAAPPPAPQVLPASTIPPSTLPPASQHQSQKLPENHTRNTGNHIEGNGAPQQQSHKSPENHTRNTGNHIEGNGSVSVPPTSVPPPPQPPQGNPSPPPRPSLRPAEKARPSRRFLDQLGLHEVSDTDVVVTIDLPKGAQLGNNSLSRTPKYTGKDLKLVFAIEAFLAKALHIPPPHLLQAVNRHDQHMDLHRELHRKWTALAAQAATTASSDSTSPPTLSPRRQDYLSSIASWDEDYPMALGSALLHTPPDVQGADRLQQWSSFLSPSTNIMQKPTEGSSGSRCVIHLSFPSRLTSLAVQAHLRHYLPLLTATPTPSELQRCQRPADQAWFRAAMKSRILPTTMAIEPYRVKRESTLVSGWTRGPDHPITPDEYVDFGQPYGNTTLLLTFLELKAPNCTPKVIFNKDRVSVHFVHEEKYRYQLYNLNGLTSPSHGITRPLSLKFSEQKKASAQVCSVCGVTDHVAFNCPGAPSINPSSPIDMDVLEEKGEAKDMDSPPQSSHNPYPSLPCVLASDFPIPRDAVCKDCYSWYHPTGACCHPPAEQFCKVCELQGHTSWSCKQYRTTWVPIKPPTTLHPPNPRPLAILAQQRGVPMTWSHVAQSGSCTPPPPQQPSPPTHRWSESSFPPLPPNGTHPPPSASAVIQPPQSAQPQSHPAQPLPHPSAPTSNDPSAVNLQQLLTAHEARLTAQEARHMAALQQLNAANQQAMLSMQQQFQQAFQLLFSLLSKSAFSAEPLFPMSPPIFAYPASQQPSQLPCPPGTSHPPSGPTPAGGFSTPSMLPFLPQQFMAPQFVNPAQGPGVSSLFSPNPVQPTPTAPGPTTFNNNNYYNAVQGTSPAAYNGIPPPASSTTVASPSSASNQALNSAPSASPPTYQQPSAPHITINE